MRTPCALVLAICACSGPPYRAAEKDPERLATADSTVLVALDEDVKSAIELVDHRCEVLPDGRLRGQIRFVNRSEDDLRVQVCWSFKDSDGFPVERESPFEHRMISAGQTVALTHESMAAGASAFHVQVKTARSAQD